MRAIASVLLILCLLIAPTAARAEIRYSIPLLGGTSTLDVGVALSNITNDGGSVTITAWDYNGLLIEGSQITNRRRLQIPAHGQLALRTTEILGSGIVGRTGWMDIYEDDGNEQKGGIKGFFLIFDSALTFIDGAELPQIPAKQLLFQRVCARPDAASTLSFVNRSLNKLSNVSITIFGTNGFTQTTTLDIPALGGFFGPVTALFPGLTSFEGYAYLDGGANAEKALVGLTAYGNGKDLAVLNAIPGGSEQSTGYIPHFANGGGYVTTVGFINTAEVDQVVTVTADALLQNGRPLPSTSSTITLLPKQALRKSVADLFGIAGQELTVGYIRWQSDQDTPGIIGYLDYGTTDGLLSAVPAPPVVGHVFFSSHIAQGLGYYTGFALLNPSNESTFVMIDAISREGQILAQTTFTLLPGERRSRVLNELFPGLIEQLGGSVRVIANQPIFAMQLFGSTDSLRFLANVPAQVIGNAPTLSQFKASQESTLSRLTTLADASQLNISTIAAGIPLPRGIWGDPANLYVSGNDCTILRISRDTGDVTLVAGETGSCGFADGVGRSARFMSPRGLWGDGSNLYVAESGGIRRINPATGEVSTLAHGNFTPNSLWGDGVNLFCTDDHHRILKVVIASGQFGIFAGSSKGHADGIGVNAKFNFPQEIWGDGTYLYVTEDSNAIRKINPTTAEVTSILSSTLRVGGVFGVPAFTFIRGGLWGDNNYLYIAESYLGIVQRMNLATQEMTVLAGGQLPPSFPVGPGSIPPTAGFADGPGPTSEFGSVGRLWGTTSKLYLLDAGTIRTGEAIRAPILTSIGPASGTAGTSLTVTLNGANFGAGATVNVTGEGVTVSNIEVINDTTLTAVLNIGISLAAETRQISVTTAEGKSYARSFTIVTP